MPTWVAVTLWPLSTCSRHSFTIKKCFLNEQISHGTETFFRKFNTQERGSESNNLNEEFPLKRNSNSNILVVMATEVSLQKWLSWKSVDKKFSQKLSTSGICTLATISSPSKFLLNGES